MPGIQREELLVLAFDEAHDGFGLGQGADVVFFACNIEHRASNIGEIYPTPSELDLTLDQFVLLIKVADPLAESLAGEWYTIVHPLAHRQPCVHRLTLHDAVPHCDIGADVVGDRLDHTVTGIDEFAWDVAKGIHYEIGVKVFLAGPDSIESHVIWCEVYGSGHQYEVPEGFAWEECGIHGAHRAAHAVSQQSEFLRMGGSEHLLYGSRNIV